MNTHQTQQPSTAFAPEEAWHKSSYSDGTGNNCIEAATRTTKIGIRDSKDTRRPALIFPQAAWIAFVMSVRNGTITTEPHA
ncbi:DUF397 domain-containing protein [Streptomyces sp. NPDC003635]